MGGSVWNKPAAQQPEISAQSSSQYDYQPGPLDSAFGPLDDNSGPQNENFGDVRPLWAEVFAEDWAKREAVARGAVPGESAAAATATPSFGGNVAGVDIGSGGKGDETEGDAAEGIQAETAGSLGSYHHMPNEAQASDESRGSDADASGGRWAADVQQSAAEVPSYSFGGGSESYSSGGGSSFGGGGSGGGQDSSGGDSGGWDDGGGDSGGDDDSSWDD